MQHNPRFTFNAPNPGYAPAKLPLTDPLVLQGKDVPERKWIVTNWIPHGQVTMLGGDGGIGKSLLAMQLLTAVAIGKSWLGLPTVACKAIGFYCEDDEEEIWRRQAAVNLHYGVEFGDLENLKWKSLVGADAGLIGFEHDRGEPTELVNQILIAAIDFGAQVVCIDSLHDVFYGNENNRIHARQFINMLRDLAMGFDGAIILTAHPSLSGLASGSGFSGSTAWNNAVRSRLYLHRPEGDVAADEAERILTRKKSNYARAGESLTLNCRDGVLVANAPQVGALAGMQGRNAERVFLEQLKAVTEQGRHVSESTNSGNYAPRLFAKGPAREGFNKVDFVKAMERLFADGKVKVEPYGRLGDNHRHIVALNREIGRE